MEYYEFPSLQKVNLTEISGARAQGVVRAISRNRDYSMIEAFVPVEDPTKHSVLVVNVECDGVPPHNAAGINYRERLAILIPLEPSKLVQVYALRKSFPILMHQHQGSESSPVGLCLYFESDMAVYRTWTPENFLLRIQWWLEKTATGELHPADQPVEDVFFSSKYDLILPWDFDKADGQAYQLLRGKERPDGGFSCFLTPLEKKADTSLIADHFEFTLPPIVSGQVERDPSTLGELLSLFEKRGAGLFDVLCDSLKNKVSKDGCHKNNDGRYVVLIFRIPICRISEGDIESFSHRAFLIPLGPLAFGEVVGALFLHEDKYYRNFEIGTVVPQLSHPEQTIFAMQILQQNTGEKSRKQSGINNAGPSGALVGAGALGSAMLDLWVRSGWGNWLAIDTDYIKPHNLIRHTADSLALGIPKAEAVSVLADYVTQGAVKVEYLIRDATQLQDEHLHNQIQDREIVIDASTTLEYPRLISAQDKVPRHISVFLTPNGNGAVLLAEDSQRNHRLRTLEAQYYRAVIEGDWGDEHLVGHLGRFWSGASCRDISVVMPYSRIVAHAATLAEQIQIAWEKTESKILVWNRDPCNGSVDLYNVPVFDEYHLELIDLTLYMDEGLKSQLYEQRRNHSPNETGGILLGYYDFNIKSVFIVKALPAPQDSVHSETEFERGQKGVLEAVTKARDLTAGIVGYVGEWHSHPPYHKANASPKDLHQLSYLASNMANEGLPAISLIVGENDIQLYHGTAL